LTNDKQTLNNVIAVSAKKSKEAKNNIKKAEAKSKKSSKDPVKLQTSIQELNKSLQEAQEIHMNSLLSALILQRGKYCSVATHMANVFDKLTLVHEAEAKVLSHHTKLRELGKQTKAIATDIAELCKKKMRTLIDVSFFYDSYVFISS